MKKLGVILVALLLVLIPSVALASEMYDLYGPMEEWDEDTLLECEEWSDEQWDDYWQGEKDASEQQWQQYRYEEKLRLGCPYPEGVNIKLNESFLLFPEQMPQYVEGGVYLPVRAFLSAAGVKATVSYDANNRSVTVTLADGRTLVAYADDDTLLISGAGGEPRELYSYSAPQLLDGCMYVEEWDICRFLGWDSYWDYSLNILYVVNPEPLIAAIDNDFTIINRLFKGVKTPDMEQAHKFSYSMELSGLLYSETGGDNISASISCTGIQRGLDMDVSFAIKLDLKQMKDSLLYDLDAEDWRYINAIGAGKGRVIVNSTEGAVYIQSNLLPLFDKSLSATDWLKLSFMPEELDMLLASDTVLQQLATLSLGRLIYEGSSAGYYYSDSDVYARTLDTAKMWQGLLGDDNFSKTSRGGYDVYALTEAKEQPVSGLSLPGSDLFGGVFGYYYGYDEDPVEFSRHLSFREKNGQVQDMELKAGAQTTGYVPMTYTLELKADQRHAEGNLEIKGRYVGKLTLSLKYDISPTAEAPATAPPEGSNIVDDEKLNPRPVYVY